MKRTLQIHIDANRVTCGKCEWYNPRGGFALGRCTLFTGDNVIDLLDGEPKRCAPCLAAEREASDARL